MFLHHGQFFYRTHLAYLVIMIAHFPYIVCCHHYHLKIVVPNACKAITPQSHPLTKEDQNLLNEYNLGAPPHITVCNIHYKTPDKNSLIALEYVPPIMMSNSIRNPYSFFQKVSDIVRLDKTDAFSIINFVRAKNKTHPYIRNAFYIFNKQEPSQNQTYTGLAYTHVTEEEIQNKVLLPSGTSIRPFNSQETRDLMTSIIKHRMNKVLHNNQLNNFQEAFFQHLKKKHYSLPAENKSLAAIKAENLFLCQLITGYNRRYLPDMNIPKPIINYIVNYNFHTGAFILLYLCFNQDNFTDHLNQTQSIPKD
ncbi:MAG: hypothetical protein WBQ73_03995 [Candidatus Babeliales bacterium]